MQETKKSTIHFDAEIHQALQIRIANTQQSISDYVNEAVRLALREDLEDLNVFEDRAYEPTMSYEDFLEDLKVHGKRSH